MSHDVCVCVCVCVHLHMKVICVVCAEEPKVLISFFVKKNSAVCHMMCVCVGGVGVPEHVDDMCGLC